MANTIAPTISGTSQPGLDFSPQPNVKYYLVLNLHLLLCVNIQFMTSEPTLSQTRIPHITMCHT
jgi:hypothetical protein